MPIRFIFFFNDTATTEIYTLSLHDALPISRLASADPACQDAVERPLTRARPVDELREPERLARANRSGSRSEEHTSELQSRSDLVCRLLLEKKKYTLSTLTHYAAYHAWSCH